MQRRRFIQGALLVPTLPYVARRLTRPASAQSPPLTLPKSAFFNNGYNPWNPGRFGDPGTVIVNDAQSLQMPLTTMEFYFNVNFQSAFRWPSISSLIVPNITRHDIFGNNDAYGHGSLRISMLPANPILGSSNMTRPVLALRMTDGWAEQHQVLAMWPDLARYDVDWHNVQISVNVIPTNPPRWNILGGVDGIIRPPLFFDQNWNRLAGLNSVYPPAFQIPLVVSGANYNNLGRSDFYMYSVGQPVTSAIAGLRPTALGPHQVFTGQLAGLYFLPHSDPTVSSLTSMVYNGFINSSTVVADIVQNHLSITQAGLADTLTALNGVIANPASLTSEIQNRINYNVNIALAAAGVANGFANQLTQSIKASVAQVIANATPVAAGFPQYPSPITADIIIAQNQALTAQIQATNASKLTLQSYSPPTMIASTTNPSGTMNLSNGLSVFPNSNLPTVYLLGNGGEIVIDPSSPIYGFPSNSQSFSYNQGDGGGNTGTATEPGSTSFYTPIGGSNPYFGFSFPESGFNDPY